LAWSVAGSFVMAASTEPFASFADTQIPYTWGADGALDWEKDAE